MSGLSQVSSIHILITDIQNNSWTWRTIYNEDGDFSYFDEQNQRQSYKYLKINHPIQAQKEVASCHVFQWKQCHVQETLLEFDLIWETRGHHWAGRPSSPQTVKAAEAPWGHVTCRCHSGLGIESPRVGLVQVRLQWTDGGDKDGCRGVRQRQSWRQGSVLASIIIQSLIRETSNLLDVKPCLVAKWKISNRILQSSLVAGL